MRTLIVLPGGTEVYSGAAGAAVIRAAISRSCNTETDLTPGAVVPAKLALRLCETTVAPGDRLTVYRVDADGNRTLQGVFLTHTVKRRGVATWDILAYDALCLLEQDLTDWLAGLDGWPYTLQDLAHMVCTACGLNFDTQNIPCSDVPVWKFAVRDVTGADLLGWIAQLSGCFCRANRQGDVEFAWYDTSAVSHVGTTDVRQNGAGTGLWYYQDSLIRQSQPVMPVERVLLRRDVADVGVGYPDSGGNTCILSHPMLSAMLAEDLRTVAKNLYERMWALAYTPCELVLPGDAQVQPGQILSVTDSRGETFSTCVTHTERENGRIHVRSTGNYLRDNTRALRTVAGLRGKMLSLQVDVDGIRAENTDAAGRVTQLELDVEGIRTQVSHRQEQEDALQSRVSTMEQRADAVEISVRQLTDNGTDRVVTKTGYSFAEDGLTIRRQGQRMCNLLDHTGMYVKRDEQTILQVNNEGVEAADVTVRNYLVVGDHARFEDHKTGTACYYI